MSKYIDSGDLLYELSGKIADSFDAEWFEKVEAAIDKMPELNIESVKHGKWHRHPSGSVICSNCGDWELWPDEDTVKHWHYCPNCGAKMEEE